MSVSTKVGTPVSLKGQRFTVQMPTSQSPAVKASIPATSAVQNVLINPSLISSKDILITTNMVSSQNTASESSNALKIKCEDDDDRDNLYWSWTWWRKWASQTHFIGNRNLVPKEQLSVNPGPSGHPLSGLGESWNLRTPDGAQDSKEGFTDPRRVGPTPQLLHPVTGMALALLLSQERIQSIPVSQENHSESGPSCPASPRQQCHRLS
eukprot:bmy_16843T0